MSRWGSTEDKSHIDWSYLEECPCSKKDEYEVAENGNAPGFSANDV